MHQIVQRTPNPMHAANGSVASLLQAGRPRFTIAEVGSPVGNDAAHEP